MKLIHCYIERFRNIENQEVSLSDEFEHIEAAVTDEMLNSTKPEDLERCLEAGKIPTAYAGILDTPQIGVRKSYECTAPSNIKEMSDEELLQLALQGYFVRDAAKNLVYCLQGSILPQKSLKKDGRIRYCNKLACKKCSHKCTKSAFKEADFNKDTLIMKAQNYSVDSGNQNDDQHPPMTKMKREVKEHKIVTIQTSFRQEEDVAKNVSLRTPFWNDEKNFGCILLFIENEG